MVESIMESKTIQIVKFLASLLLVPHLLSVLKELEEYKDKVLFVAYLALSKILTFGLLILMIFRYNLIT